MRRVAALLFASVACTDVGTDPNAVVALRFEGSAYPSIVAGDSLRDSLGALQPLVAIPLNYLNEPVESAPVVFSSPDTVLRLFDDGVVYATRRKQADSVTVVYATVGSLQSQPDSLFTVPRADSLARVVAEDTANAGTGGATTPDELAFTVFGDTVAGQPKRAVQAWLVSFQLRYRGALLSPSDSSVAYSWTGTNRRILSFVDTTDASGRVGRKVFIRAPRTPEDTIFVIATMRQRKVGSAPLSAETRLVIRPGTSTTHRAPTP